MKIIRSLSLDTWTDRQLEFMRVGGNERGMKIFGEMERDIQKKYNSEAATEYR